MEPGAHRWSFRFGDVLPAADVRARFVISIGAALNDLVFLNRLYVSDPTWGLMRREATAAERVYLVRLVSSAIFELGRLIDKGRREPPISDLLDRLSKDGKADLQGFLSFGRLRAALRRVRDTTSHYPWPNEMQLIKHLGELADWEGDFVGHPSSIASIRAGFADTVLLQFFVGEEAEGLDEAQSQALLRDLIADLTGMVVAGIRLCQHIIVGYLEALPDHVLHYEPVDIQG